MNRLMNRLVSIEREFALHRQGERLGASGTQQFAAAIKKPLYDLLCSIDNGRQELDAVRSSALDRIVDKEVGVNCVEIKAPFISAADVRTFIGRARAIIEAEATTNGIEVSWTNQKFFNEKIEFNKYFTMLAYPELVKYFVAANSTQFHVECSALEGIRVFNGLNALAPWFIMESTQKGDFMNRLAFVKASAQIMGPLYFPPILNSFDDYLAYAKECSAVVEGRITRSEAMQVVRGNFKVFDDSGTLALTPDKIFNPARLRPDLLLPNGNFSVEFRAMDGVASMEEEIRLLQMGIASVDSILKQVPELDSQGLREFYLNPTTNSVAYRSAREYIMDMRIEG